MSPKPPGTFRVAVLLAGLALRRRANRLALFARKRKKSRNATPRKTSKGGAALLLFFGALMMLQAFLMSAQVVSRYTVVLEPANRPLDAHHMVREHLGPGLDERWPTDPVHEAALLNALGLTLTLLVTAILFTNLGAANQDLGKVRWGTEWLFSFPAPARSLFLAKLLEYALTDLFCWVAVFPFLSIVIGRAGLAGWGVLAGVAGTFALALTISSIRLYTETWLRKTMPLHRVKNVQALCTVIGLLLLFLTFWIALAWPVPAGIKSFATGVTPLFAWTPFAIPVLIAKSAAAALALAAGALAAAAITVNLCGRLVRDGLVNDSGAVFRGARGKDARPARGPALGGILGKEVRLLLRDRNFFVQTLVTPLLIIAFQALLNRQLFGHGGVSGAILAYGVGAYVLMFGAFSVLSVERESLWLLWTFPVTVSDLLRKKARLWASAALVYAITVLAFAWRPGSPPRPVEIVAPFMAVLGIVLSAFLAAGIGAIGTDPFEDRPNRRVGAQWVYLYMLLATLYGYGIFMPALWPKLVLIVLYGLLVLAIWQKADERLPLLLDPTLNPPKRIDLADGMLYALLFFVIGNAAGLFWVAVGVTDPGAILLFAFVTGGLVTSLIAAVGLGGERIADVLRYGRDRASPLLPGVSKGATAGLGAAIAGVGWLLLLSSVPALRELRDRAMQAPGGLGGGSFWTTAALAVVAAPLFEEFLFRGIVFRGLTRVTGARMAVLGSALVFALVHPPVAFPAVFILGATAATMYRKTGTLWAAVACHAVYNAIMVGLSALS